MTRRGLLALLPGLTFIPWLKPEPTKPRSFTKMRYYAQWRSTDGGTFELVESRGVAFYRGNMYIGEEPCAFYRHAEGASK